MYQISDQQIDYILSDISARGVEMESLQQNLLDHVCCIIENNLEVNGDFENFYKKTIATFYKDELWEIEEETLLILTYKNYYTMKKIMIYSGTFSAAAMILGIIFKFMHWPGASALIILGIGTSSLIFLPLLYLLKAQDKHQIKDKLILGLGILSGILFSLSILFKVMHWPYAMIMGYSAIFITGLIVMPIYFFTGIKHPDNKINTITVSIIIIMVCGLWLTLIRSPKGSRIKMIEDTSIYLVNEKIISTEKKLVDDRLKNDSLSHKPNDLAMPIFDLCNQLKSRIIFNETGSEKISNDFEAKDQFITDRAYDDFEYSRPKIDSLLNFIKKYNGAINSGQITIPYVATRANHENSYNLFVGTTYETLNQLSQIQLIVLQNERL